MLVETEEPWEWISGDGTISVRTQLHDVSDADVDDTEEALVLLLELLLVKDLYGQDAVLIDAAMGCERQLLFPGGLG